MNERTTAASSGAQTGDRESASFSPCPSTKFDVDLPAMASAFGQRLHEAGMPVTPTHSVQYATALHLTKPDSRQRLYLTTRAIFVRDLQQMETFDLVFAKVFDSCDRTTADDFDVELPAPAAHV